MHENQSGGILDVLNDLIENAISSIFLDYTLYREMINSLQMPWPVGLTPTFILHVRMDLGLDQLTFLFRPGQPFE